MTLSRGIKYKPAFWEVFHGRFIFRALAVVFLLVRRDLFRDLRGRFNSYHLQLVSCWRPRALVIVFSGTTSPTKSLDEVASQLIASETGFCWI